MTKKKPIADPGPLLPVGTKVRLLRPHLFAGKEGVIGKSHEEFQIVLIGGPGQPKWSTGATREQMEVIQ